MTFSRISMIVVCAIVAGGCPHSGQRFDAPTVEIVASYSNFGPVRGGTVAIVAFAVSDGDPWRQFDLVVAAASEQRFESVSRDIVAAEIAELESRCPDSLGPLGLYAYRWCENNAPLGALSQAAVDVGADYHAYYLLEGQECGANKCTWRLHFDLAPAGEYTTTHRAGFVASWRGLPDEPSVALALREGLATLERPRSRDAPFP